MGKVIHTHTYLAGNTLELVHGDLTIQAVDAIVNAANAWLQHGGGLAAAIVARGGQEIQVESDAWVQAHGMVPHTAPAITSGGRLPCKFILHAVGPVWGSGEEDTKLSQAVQGCLTEAERLGCHSLAIPPISTGIFGFPKDRAARIIYTTLDRYFNGCPASCIRLVRLTIIDEPTLVTFARIFLEMYPSG
ncbi:MAG TPA: macro domain-containing protein [Anaerolineaceae bacterium]